MSARTNSDPDVSSTTGSYGSIPTTTTAGAGGRKYSLNIPPEMIEKMEKRRASLEKLQVDKIAPWMYLYDFEHGEWDDQYKG